MRWLTSLRSAWNRFDGRNCLPNPPEYEQRANRSWGDHVKIWKAACQDYMKDFELMAAQRREDAKWLKEKQEREKHLMELASEAKGAAADAMPIVQQLIGDRLSLLRESVSEFVGGYKDGYRGQANPSADSSPSPPPHESEHKQEKSVKT